MVINELNKSTLDLAIPCHWDVAVLDEVMEFNKAAGDVRIFEMYGTLASGAIAHGRSEESVPQISADQAVVFRNYLKNKYCINFVYVINGPAIKSELTEAEKSYIDWIITVFKADAIMVTAFIYIEYIQTHYPNAHIYISTIAGIKTVEDLLPYMAYKPRKIVGHHDLNRNFADLESLKNFCDENSVELELMVTESCLRGCLKRDAHYHHIASRNKDINFHTDCNSKKIATPYEFLKSNFIRPEDLDVYKSLGICKFKITGRSKPSSWLPEVVNAYLQKKYQGNLIRLLGIDPKYEFERWINLDNSALNGFLENFPHSQDAIEENNYCDNWIRKLYDNGKFEVKNVRYEIDASGYLKGVCLNGNKDISKELYEKK